MLTFLYFKAFAFLIDRFFTIETSIMIFLTTIFFIIVAFILAIITIEKNKVKRAVRSLALRYRSALFGMW
ncbi:MAG TPA: hypothetical protein VIG73_00490 [Cerasibacillus sp.]|uniref:hypothetical protein n=1 Tax=Cerasibacillus sp. TaxID=2498711 RepID=UPI002F3FD2EB